MPDFKKSAEGEKGLKVISLRSGMLSSGLRSLSRPSSFRKLRLKSGVGGKLYMPLCSSPGTTRIMSFECTSAVRLRTLSSRGTVLSPGGDMRATEDLGDRGDSHRGRYHIVEDTMNTGQPDVVRDPTHSRDLPSPLHIPEHPPRLHRRPPRKGTKRETLEDIARRVPVDVIRPYFNYPLRTAADALSISVTTLKRLCRRHGVKRWPHRQLSGLNRAVAHLESKRLNTDEDPIIRDQLRQLYQRRDVVIELAFVSDDSVLDNQASSLETDYAERYTGDEASLPSTRDMEVEIPLGGPGDAWGKDDTPIPWWHRDAKSRTRNVDRRGGSGGGGGGPNISAANGGAMAANGGGGGSSECTPIFRASSVLVRLPDVASQSPLSATMESQQTSRDMLEHQPPAPPLRAYERSPTGDMPSLSSYNPSIANFAVDIAGSGQSRRSVSPMTISYPPRMLADLSGTGTIRSQPTHSHPCSRSHEIDNIDRQVTELSALNDILFGPDDKDPQLYAAAQARAAAAAAANNQSYYHRPKALTLAALESSASRATVADQLHDERETESRWYCTGGRRDAEETLEEHENGKLPSIAGLVAAGAYLSGDGDRP